MSLRMIPNVNGIPDRVQRALLPSEVHQSTLRHKERNPGQTGGQGGAAGQSAHELPMTSAHTADYANAAAAAHKRTPHALRHLAIIPDGNRRWSRQRGASLEHTYAQGCAKMFELCKSLLNAQGSIEEISLFFVSAENLRSRRAGELDPLFRAGHHFLDLFYSATEFSHVHLRWVGLHQNDFVVDSSAHAGLVDRIRKLERPAHGTRTANVLFGYDVRRDIEDAMSRSDEFRYENLAVNRPVDLIIRSGGEKRLSGFLPLVTQYAEFEFIDKLFPDVELGDVTECIHRFESSARRFGV